MTRVTNKRALIFVGLAVIVSCGMGLLSESVRRAEVDRKLKIERESAIAAGKAIQPGLTHYAELLEGKLPMSALQAKKEAAALRGLAEIARNQNSKKMATSDLNLLGYYTYPWDELSDDLTRSAQYAEALLGEKANGSTGWTSIQNQRAASAVLHRKLASVLQKSTDEGFLWKLSDNARIAVVQRPASSKSRSDFIKETEDLPPTAIRALDKIYKADPVRAWQLSREAHESGLQHSPNQ